MTRSSKLLVVLSAVVIAAGCDDTGKKSATLDSSRFPPGPERVSRFEKLIQGGPPGAIRDVQFFEEMTSGGSFPPGPSDFEFYAKITVEPGELPAWLARTTPISRPDARPRPGPASSSPPSWWMSPEAADSAQYYDPKPLFGRAHGFMAVVEGTIYVWNFTL